MTMVQEFQKKKKKKKKKIEEKNRVLKSAKKLFVARDDITDLSEKGISLYKDNAFKTKKKEESEESKFKKIKDDYKKFIKYIEDE